MLIWIYILRRFVYTSKYWVRYIFKRADNLFSKNVYMRVGGMRYKKEVRSIEAIFECWNFRPFSKMKGEWLGMVWSRERE